MTGREMAKDTKTRQSDFRKSMKAKGYKQKTFYLNDKSIKQLKAKAKKAGLTLNDYIAKLIKDANQ